MDLMKYAFGMSLIVGCGSPNIDGEMEASHGLEEPTVEIATLDNQLGAGRKPLEVNFEACSEFAGLTFVPTQNVESLVPGGFELAHFTTEAEAVVVVRVANCAAVSVKNGPARAGTVAQVGVTLAGPDATSDINNYTLWYVTDNRKLAQELVKYGVDAEYSSDITYAFTPDSSGTGPFDIAVSAASAPDYFLEGSASVPTSAAVPFVASWWYESCRGTVQMRTTLPQIQFSSSSMTLTALGNRFQDIVGTGPVSFPGLDSYNTFDQATMIVTSN